MKIVAFSGKRRAGKDLAATALVDLGYEKIALAEPLKMFLGDVLGLPEGDARLWGPSQRREEIIPSVGRSVREMLQTLGTEWGRDSVHPDVWINFLLRRCEQDRAYKFVVTDVRFPNELVRIKEVGGKVIRIRRPSVEMDDAASHHASETSLDGMPDDAFTHVIINDGTHAEFVEKVRRVVS